MVPIKWKRLTEPNGIRVKNDNAERDTIKKGHVKNSFHVNFLMKNGDRQGTIVYQKKGFSVFCFYLLFDNPEHY